MTGLTELNMKPVMKIITCKTYATKSHCTVTVNEYGWYHTFEVFTHISSISKIWKQEITVGLIIADII